jgi:hypothetical protein
MSRPQLHVIQGGDDENRRRAVLEQVRLRWGDAGVEAVREQVRSGTAAQLAAWHRRATYFEDLPDVLDLSRKLVASPCRVEDLLELLEHRGRVCMSFVFLRFAPHRAWDEQRVRCDVPWLADLQDDQPVVRHLCRQGWLLIACGEPGQACALSSSVRRGALRSSVHHVAGEQPLSLLEAPQTKS